MIKSIIYYLVLATALLCVEESAAESQKYPVDVSFLVADLKYSEENGVKFCEIQHAIYSTFFGDRYSYGNDGNIAPHFVKTIEQLPGPYWTYLNHFADFGLINSIKNQNWSIRENFDEIKSDPIFKANSKKSPEDPFDISTYHGLVYLPQYEIKNIEAFRSEHPGIIVMDAATWDVWYDKYKMSALFDQNGELSQFKPRWKLYPKKYKKKLAKTIIEDLKCDRFVIKPRSEYKGKGVIIVEKNDLDKTLKHILTKNSALKNDKEPCVQYWYENASDSFIVEQFVSSDPVVVEHLGGKLYEPTIRVAFLLIHNNNSIHVEFCGGYLRVPSIALGEPGTLSEQFKDVGEEPYFDKIDPVVYEKIKDELRLALPLLYEQMLNPKTK